MQLKWLVREAVLQRCRIAGSLAESRRCGVADFWGGRDHGGWASYNPLHPPPIVPSMVQLHSRTSLTIDEAIANLIGLTEGPIQYQCRDGNASTAEMAELDALSYDVNEEIWDDYQYHCAELAEARHDKASAIVISDLSAKVARAEHFIRLANRCRAAIDDELLRQPSALLVDSRLSTTDTTYITLESLIRWASTNSTISDVCQQLTSVTANQHSKSNIDTSKPWWHACQDDPPAEQPWYTPARYFARQCLAADPTLRQKRERLARKVAEKLAESGINKRGGVKPFESSTILKAFSNVIL